LLTRVDRLIALPENMLSRTMAQRAWNGVRVDVTEFHCVGRVAHHLHHETETRLSVLLEEVGSLVSRACARTSKQPA
jgi:AraC family transcriptional regulator